MIYASLRFAPFLALLVAPLACSGDSVGTSATDTDTDSTTAATDESASSTSSGTSSGSTTVSSETTTTDPSATDPSATDPSATDPSTTDPSATDPTTTDPTTTGGNGVCGNGVVEAPEECDDGANNNDLVQGACRTDCSAAGCGDLVVDYTLGEECDDGNIAGGDGCSATCEVEVGAACGDGKLNPNQGEECDDGNKAAGDGCSPTCQLEPVGASCGDGKIDPLEICDDSNLQNGDACNPTCNLGNKTTLFIGAPGVGGMIDGIGMAARIQGGSITADNQHLWLADGQNNALRRIDIASGAVLTVAGSLMGMAGDLDNAVGTNARFMGLESVATDGVNLWVSSNRKIKQVSGTAPYAVTTVAGNGQQGLVDGVGAAARFDDLRGLTYYGGMLYMLDANGAVLRRFDPTTQEVLTLAGTPYQLGTVDGVGSAARFVSPRYMASDNSGVLYIADTNGFHIRSFNTKTSHVATFAGSGMAGYIDGVGAGASIHRPRGMTSDGTSLYFVEFNQHTVRQGVLATGSISTNVGQHCNGGMCTGGYTEGVGVAARLNNPWSLAYHHPSKTLFVVDNGNHVIRKIQ